MQFPITKDGNCDWDTFGGLAMDTTNPRQSKRPKLSYEDASVEGKEFDDTANFDDRDFCD